MKRKFLISLAPVLAIAALAVVPMAAQAATPPHYFVNGLRAGVTPVTTIGWGTITLKATEGSPAGANLVCHNSAAGTLFNPAPGGAEGPAGEGLVQVFATYDCEQTLICPEGAEKGAKVLADPKHLPWKDLLTEEVAGTIRQETTGIRVVVECEAAGKVIAEIPYIVGKKKGSVEAEKGQRPKGVKGTSALHPGFLEFDSESGELEVEGSLGTTRGKTEGAVKTLGYNAQELTSVKPG